MLNDAAVWKQVLADIAASPEARTVLREEAGRHLNGETINIVALKKHLPASGDPHDYHSLAPYWWPNPATADGLPWINRDGEVNPLHYEFDSTKLELFCFAVPRLILFARAGNSEAHARRAGKLLQAWFLDRETRMNPHLRYAQCIPGRCDGRNIGIIDTTSLVFLLDAVTQLEFNPDWTPEHLVALKTWVAQYLEWLRTSAFGKQEEAEHNNHGTWFDAQVACFAVFCGRKEIAAAQIENRSKPRIVAQIAADGAQPAELKRTLSLTYCTYNLVAYACLARVARTCGIDLWTWQGPQGGTLQSAMQWMLPYYAQQRVWERPQIKPFNFASAAVLLTLAESVPGSSLANAKLEQYPWQRVLLSKGSLAARSYPGSGR